MNTGQARPTTGFWRSKRVFITGHTGFKGGWLASWLHELGAVIAGYALPPPTTPNMFTLCRVDQMLSHIEGDVRNAAKLAGAISRFSPEIVFHLAAQPLVRASYAQPVETFSTNVMGTVNLLHAVNQLARHTVTLVITSDKVYAEAGTANRHAESNPLGGYDPYSASKACAELVTASFPMEAHHRLATARSGNVIGGGDWATDRLLPDFMRAMIGGETLMIRNADAIRPWQHVLDPLCGYLAAAEYLWARRPASRPSWNFGPDPCSEVTVAEIAMRLCRLWGNNARFAVQPPQETPHEAPVLRLDSTKAKQDLGWQPGLTLDEALTRTTDWCREYSKGADMKSITLSQIAQHGAL